jgi:ABC-type nitrate/sulfonate/bicarbonate transport system ATPase subunit
MTAVGTPVLEARHLTLSWDGERIVVRDLSLAVDAGETVCVVGQSGCGKTTILHALAGLTRPLEGQVLICGQDVTGVPGQVSYMLQKDLLIPSKRVIDNVCLPLVLRGVGTREARAEVAPLFERFGLSGTEDRWPHELSGGMRQRAAFLRTYVQGHAVVLLDEPFSALDALTRADLRTWYVDMAREAGMASVVITHDVDEALAMARRIYVLSGNPRTGVPTVLAGELVVPRPQAADEDLGSDFSLTPAYAACKRRILELLG